MSKRTPSLIHRGYLYAQKHADVSAASNPTERTRLRMSHAEAWRQGNLQARRDAKKT